MVLRNDDGVVLERTGFRDDSLQNRIENTWGGEGLIATDIANGSVSDSISDRHRGYGNNCPATNIDCLLYEYNHMQPVAIIDFKARRLAANDRTSFNARATANLCNMARIPFYLASYSNSEWSFILAPVNAIATQLMQKHGMTETKMSELQFVTFLYDLRGKRLPSETVQKLNTNFG